MKKDKNDKIAVEVMPINQDAIMHKSFDTDDEFKQIKKTSAKIFQMFFKYVANTRKLQGKYVIMHGDGKYQYVRTQKLIKYVTHKLPKSLVKIFKWLNSSSNLKLTLGATAKSPALDCFQIIADNPHAMSGY